MWQNPLWLKDPEDLHQNQLQDHQNHPQDHQNRLQWLQNHPISSPPWVGLLICMVLIVQDVVLMLLAAVLVALMCFWGRGGES